MAWAIFGSTTTEAQLGPSGRVNVEGPQDRVAHLSFSPNPALPIDKDFRFIFDFSGFDDLELGYGSCCVSWEWAATLGQRPVAPPGQRTGCPTVWLRSRRMCQGCSAGNWPERGMRPTPTLSHRRQEQKGKDFVLAAFQRGGLLGEQGFSSITSLTVTECEIPHLRPSEGEVSSPLDIADGRQAAPSGGEGLHATDGRGRREEEDGFDSDLVNYHYPGAWLHCFSNKAGETRQIRTSTMCTLQAFSTTTRRTTQGNENLISYTAH